MIKRNTLVRLAALAMVLACTDGSPTDPTAAAGPEFLGPTLDNVANNLDNSIEATAEIMPLTVGGANGTTVLYIDATNEDGKNGCNLTGSTVLTVSVSSSNTGVATVSPSSVTFDGCGAQRALTVAPVAAGSTTISVSITSNTTGATFTLDPATFTVNVTPPPNTAPTIAVAGVTGGAVYNKGSVPSATCQVTDAQDGNKSFPATLSAITGLYASDGIGSQTASCSYTDGGGLTAAGSVTYSIADPSAPTLASILDPTAPDGLNGWYKSDVDLTWNVGELQSPNSLQKTGCIDQNITADQAATTYDCSATSAGGSAGPLSITIKRDATAPSIDGSGSPAANGVGWNNTNVAVSFTCDDNLSGVASCGPGATKSIEGANQSVTGNAADKAGNTNSATVTVSIDKTDPTISGSRSPAANGAGWNKTDVAVSFLCADALSGIDSCPASQTLSSEGADLSASGTASDKAGNSASTTVSDIKIDKTAPTASASKSPAANTFGWNKGTVTVSFTGLDALSGIANCDAETTLASEGADQLASGTCTDNAGNESAAATVKVHIDKTAPTISGARSPAANANGWNNADVAVSFTCTDALSGFGPCGPNETVSAEGAGQSVTGNVEDYAGNAASATVTGISIDKTDPTITGSRSPDANAKGWNNSAVSVSFECADALSGVASCSDPTTVSSEGDSHSVTGTATDKAGNSASDEVGGIKIDKTAPTISGAALTSPNLAGWYKNPVTVRFTCADALSDIDSCTADQLLSSNAQGQSASGTAKDNAGNTASTTVSGINIDQIAPSVSVTGVANGATYVVGDVPTAGCSTTDPLSGVATEATLASTGGPMGSVTVTCSGGADKAGNTANAVGVTYKVVYTKSAYLEPIPADVNYLSRAFKAGSTIPVKFQLQNASTGYVRTAVATITMVKVDGTTGLDVPETISLAADNGGRFRYSLDGEQYIYNLGTTKSQVGTYRIVSTLDDGTTISQRVVLK